jgi:hypothetical protein
MAPQVERLQGVVRDRRANWAQSLATLRAAKAAGARVTKTSIMLGLGASILPLCLTMIFVGRLMQYVQLYKLLLGGLCAAV